MIRSIRNSVWILLISMAGCKSKLVDDALPFFNKPDLTPEWISKTSTNYQTIHTIPAFSFTDQDGIAISEKTVEGKIYVADFIYTRCNGICPRMTNNMTILQQYFINDTSILLLSHSVTPDIDSVAVLKKYAEKKGVISSKWHLLTGKRDEIYTLARQQYYAGDTVGYYQNSDQFLHTENFLLIDRHRRIRGVYNGTLPLEMQRIEEDIAILKKEND